MKNSLENRLIVRIDTKLPLPAEVSLSLASDLVTSLRDRPGFPDGAEFIIDQMGEGTWWINLLLIAGGIGGIAAGAEGLLQDLRKGEGPFASRAVTVMDEYDAKTCQIITADFDVIVERTTMVVSSDRSPAKPLKKSTKKLRDEIARNLKKNGQVLLQGSFLRTTSGTYFTSMNGRTYDVEGTFDPKTTGSVVVVGWVVEKMDKKKKPLLHVHRVVRMSDSKS